MSLTTSSNINNLNRPKVLLVEDEATTRDVLELRLESLLGYKCQSASNPAEAKKLIAEHDFKLVITDIMMPNDKDEEIDDEAGYKFGCDLFKAKPEIKIICLTGRADEEIEEKIRLASKNNNFNLVDFFRKPFANRAFKTALEQAMR